MHFLSWWKKRKWSHLSLVIGLSAVWCIYVLSPATCKIFQAEFWKILQWWKRDKAQTGCLDRGRKQLSCLAADVKVPLVSSIPFLTAAPSTVIASDVEPTVSMKNASNWRRMENKCLFRSWNKLRAESKYVLLHSGSILFSWASASSQR